jgi:microcompartment protein CcmL/EutN
MTNQALGMLEIHRLIPSIEAVDAMAKVANVQIIGMENF